MKEPREPAAARPLDGPRHPPRASMVHAGVEIRSHGCIVWLPSGSLRHRKSLGACAPSPLVGEGRGGGSSERARSCLIPRPPPPTPPHKGEGRKFAVPCCNNPTLQRQPVVPCAIA